VNFTATVTSAKGAPPNGEIVTFEQGKKILGTVGLTNGSANFVTSTLTTGSANDVKAVYAGDSNFATSTSNTIAQVVDDASTTTILGSSQNPTNVGQSVTFSATVSPQFSGTTVTGNVEFFNGSSKLGTVSLSGGQASYTTTNLPASSDDSITAFYKGNNSFTSSTSNAISQAVLNGTTINATMTWDGVTRYYMLYVPGALPANPSLLVMLHGTTFDTLPANPSTRSWGWQTVANEYGFILVQPASTYNAKSGQWNWNSYFMDSAFDAGEAGSCTEPPATGCPDDAGFLRQLIVNLTSNYDINPDMVYVTGFSSGAQMTERVGVEISDLVAAIAPTSGQMEGQVDHPPPVLVPGDAVAPISVQEWHGTEDTELPPCNYGKTNYSGVIFYLDTVDDTFNYWVSQNNCKTLQTTQTLCTNDAPTSGLAGNIATGCSENNIEVQFIWEPGQGHSWIQSNDKARWLFLSAHSKQSNARNR
jgi:poly(hydroxyalkanoate) depolymerase family esterase